jgi:hypothetical protein
LIEPIVLVAGKAKKRRGLVEKGRGNLLLRDRGLATYRTHDPKVREVSKVLAKGFPACGTPQ